MNTITLSPASRRSPEAIVKQVIVKQVIVEKLEYEGWVLQQIDAGLADVKAGKILLHDEFLKTLEQARHERKREKAA